MSDNALPDPFAFWRDALQQVQKNFNQFATQQMQSEDFAKIAGPITNSTAATKRIAGEIANKYLEVLGLPTRADVQALDDRLQRIEDLLINLTAALNQGGRPAAELPGPAGRVPSRTRKPPAKMEAPPAAAAGPSRKGGAR